MENYHWGFVLMAALPMLAGALVLRRLAFGKDAGMVATVAAVIAVWLLGAALGVLAFGDPSWTSAAAGYAQPAIVSGIILLAMAWVRIKGGRT